VISPDYDIKYSIIAQLVLTAQKKTPLGALKN